MDHLTLKTYAESRNVSLEDIEYCIENGKGKNLYERYISKGYMSDGSDTKLRKFMVDQLDKDMKELGLLSENGKGDRTMEKEVKEEVTEVPAKVEAESTKEPAEEEEAIMADEEPVKEPVKEPAKTPKTRNKAPEKPKSKKKKEKHTDMGPFGIMPVTAGSVHQMKRKFLLNDKKLKMDELALMDDEQVDEEFDKKFVAIELGKDDTCFVVNKTDYDALLKFGLDLKTLTSKGD